MRLLLVNLNHIGDLLFTLPAVDALRAAHPDVEIVHLVSQATLPLVENDRRFDGVVSRPKRGLRDWLRIGWRLRRRYRFDVAINFCRNSAGLGLVTRLSGAPMRIGFTGSKDTDLFFTHRVPYDDRLHRIERNLALLEPLGIRPSAPPPMRLHLPDDLRRTATERLTVEGDGPWIGVCVGASVIQKKWPLERYIAWAVSVYRETGARFALIGGPEDRADAECFIKELKAPAVSFCGHVGLRESAALLSVCDLVIGGDTGPLQMAVAVGTPVVALFGSTEPRRTGLFHAEGELLFHRLPCCGCSPGTPCPIAVRCMSAISAEEAVQATFRLLRARTRRTA